MATRDGKQWACERKETGQIAKPQAKRKFSPLRQRMIRDMELAGLTRNTQETYIGEVVRLQNHYRTGGGVTDDGTAWHDAPKDFLVPVKELSRMIAKRFAAALQRSHLELFEQIPDTLWRRQWCSYCKPYGKGQDAVLNYLARYVFRVALTNRRLIAMDETHLTLRYKDHDTGQWRTVRLEAVQFLRRFLFHVLPKGFHKVRYYGLWHPSKRDRQARARLLLELATIPVARSPVILIADIADDALGQSDLQSCGQVVKCPKCGSMNVHRIDTIRPRNPMVAK